MSNALKTAVSWALRSTGLRQYQPYSATQPAQLRDEDLKDARLFAHRASLVRHLARPAVRVAEIGVAFGDFSEVLIETFNRRTFVAFDLFDMHQTEIVWGKPTRDVFADLDHESYYRRRMQRRSVELVTEVGLSWERLARYSDAWFDVIYVDGDHAYSGVRRDAEVCMRKLTRDGLLIFNDYIMYDHLAGVEYGIVPVVNDLVVNKGWRVLGLALNPHLFADIALTRGPLAA
jgi:Methyltransferase domain